jgi:diaminohydroxyphosphoribosylaminopyrimidine deaminase / 5-amino-6-(5-phosphoribosylamino)uracil reductase
VKPKAAGSWSCATDRATSDRRIHDDGSAVRVRGGLIREDATAGHPPAATGAKLQAADAAWMARALRLAARSLGETWPNPGVGCVIVRDGRLLAEGRHRRCGDLHAEAAALAALADGAARGATVYVTLAPCTRHGRQPPCVAAVQRAGVARVVAAIADPNQDDAARLLSEAGIAYDVGCLRPLAQHLHGGFLTRIRLGRPRLTGKWAQSRDGAIAAAPGVRSAVSCPLAYALMRRRRRACDAVVIGAGTAAADDPALTAPRPRRHGDDPGPLRIVLAADGRLPGRRLHDAAAPTLVVHGPGAAPPAGIAGLAVADPHDPAQVAAALGRLGLNEVIVEGGARVHAAWMPLYDRLEIYTGPLDLPGGVPAPPCPRDGWLREGGPQRVGATLISRWTRLG